MPYSCRVWTFVAEKLNFFFVNINNSLQLLVKVTTVYVDKMVWEVLYDVTLRSFYEICEFVDLQT